MNSSTITVLSVEFYRFGLSFTVRGETNDYIVDWNIYKGWVCSCADHTFRKSICKHITACQKYAEEHGLLLHMKLWCNDPKSNEVMV